MFKKMTIRKRITAILLMVYAVSVLLAAGIGWVVLRAEAQEVSAEKSTLFGAVMSANRQYMVKMLRPKTKELLPHTYFPEGSVGIVMLSAISRFIQEQHPEFIYKIASDNPLNMENSVDVFEKEVLAEFRDSGATEWKGMMERKGRDYYAIATPMKSKKGCMRCHSIPKAAPPDMVEQYGNRSGYGYKLGEVVGGTFIYIPAEVELDRARQKLMLFLGGFSIFFFMVLFVVDRVVVVTIIRPIESIASVAEEVSMGNLELKFDVDSEDEIKVLAEAFTRIKTSMKKAIDLLDSDDDSDIA